MRSNPILVMLAVSMFVSPMAFAQEPARVEVGIGARYMPTGWFHWSGRAGGAGTISDLRAYPALGGAPFVDYCLNRYFSIGVMPELTLNVIPRTENYPVSAMTAASLRLKVEYPGLGPLVPYLLLAPGYSWLSEYDSAGADSGDANGFVVSAYGGARLPIGKRHSIFAEVGYMRGFQRNGGVDYAPSYLVLAAGWQVSL